jgi:hypothetical protein
MKKYAAVFGLGPYQIYGIKKLSQKYKLIGFDKNKNAPGIKYTSKFYNLEKNNKFEILDICKKKKIIKFFCFSSDFSIKLINFLKKKLNLENPNNQAEITSYNKLLFRKIIKKRGISSPYFKEIKLEEANKIKLKKELKYICKPLNLSGSRGVFIFNDKKDLIKSLQKHKRYYTNKNKILIEEFIEGQMYSIEGFYFKNNFLPICVNKNYKEIKYSLANKSILINYQNSKILNEAKKLADQCCKAIKLKYAPIHLEFIIQNKTKKIYPIEIGLRGAGTYIYGTYLPIILKRNTAALEIELKENKKILNLKNNSDKQIYLYFISARKNMIFKKLNIKMLREKLRMPFDVKILKENNTEIVLKNSADDRVALIVFNFETYKNFKKNYSKIDKIMQANNFII